MLQTQGAEPLQMAVAKPEQEMAAAQQLEQEQGNAVPPMPPPPQTVSLGSRGHHRSPWVDNSECLLKASQG